MIYYWFNRKEVFEKAKEKFSKEKAIKENPIGRYKNLSQEKKYKIKEYQRKKYQELVQ